MKKATILIATLLLLSPTSAQALALSAGADIPVLAPITASSNFGIGILPRLQLGLTDNIKLSLEGGPIMSRETGEWTALQYPVLLGGTWEFGSVGDLGRPYVHILAGYTYAPGDDIPDLESNHWLTVGGGAGVNIHYKDAAFQIGFELLSPDVRGAAPHPIWLALNLGFQYSIID